MISLEKVVKEKNSAIQALNKQFSDVISLKSIKEKSQADFSGYSEEHRNSIKFVDYLTDDELVELNQMLDWNCFVIDSKGRRFGKSASSTKRNIPQQVPDPRILLMHETFNLSDKHVIEIGCFEGIHTVGLSLYAQRVTAFDSRIENVIKTSVRCKLFDLNPTVFRFNVESEASNLDWLSADLMHHVGVLYHLKDPVKHLLSLGTYIKQGIMLDTHYALEDEAVHEYEVNGKTYTYKPYREGGYADPFAGMYDFARWLQLDDIIALLQSSGFTQVDIIEKREERNGPRVLLMAKRP